MIQLLFHILLRYAEYYDFPSDLKEKPGIVILDEIDAHLHPRWQRRIIPALTKHLPNLQIICSTHSPLMLAGLREGQVQLFRWDNDGKVTVSTNESDIAGWTADELLRQFSEVPNPTDMATADRVTLFEKLSRKKTLTDSEAEKLEHLRQTIRSDLLSGPMSAQVIEFAKELERSRGLRRRSHTQKRVRIRRVRELAMHWVNRGPEPLNLPPIRSRFSQAWVKHYSQGMGSKPKDSHWRRFHDDLKRVFCGNCAYCEETTNGEIDHFKPKSKFPKLVYSWSNCLFACHESNHAKADTWPTAGYVDPCAVSAKDDPERHFVIDTQTGRTSPDSALGPHELSKAQDTIDALRLNDPYHLKKRVEWLVLFSAAVPTDHHSLTAEATERVVHFSSRERQFSSLVRTWLMEHDYPMEFYSA